MDHEKELELQSGNDLFHPSSEIVAKANVTEYEKLHQQSITNMEDFWSQRAQELDWYQPWDKVLDDSNKPFFKWFVGGKVNIVHIVPDR